MKANCVYAILPLSVSGARGETSPPNTKPLPSGYRYERKRSSFRHESRSKLSFSLYRARHISFSLAREKEMWGANVPPPLPRGAKPAPLQGATIPPFFQEGKQKAVGLSSAEMYGILIAALPKNGRRLALNSFSGMMEGYVLCPSERGAAYGYIFGSDSDRYLNRWHYRPVFSGQ